MRARFQGHCDRDRATAIYVVISSVYRTFTRNGDRKMHKQFTTTTRTPLWFSVYMTYVFKQNIYTNVHLRPPFFERLQLHIVHNSTINSRRC